MSFLNYLSALGIPTIFALVCALFRILSNQGRRISILMKAQQAQMRQDLVDKFYLYDAQGYISQRDLDDWEEAYQAYHALGTNGVLDDRRSKLMNLPSSPIQNGGTN